MRLVLVIKDGSYLPELCQYLVVSRHIRGQDTADDSLTYLPEKRWKIKVHSCITTSFNVNTTLERGERA